jgi:RHS repeat-associated protein
MVCDSTGSYQNLYVYDDFGNFRMMEEAGWVPNSYYYTGQERDGSPSGLYNLRARYYASGIGRFTQEDPVFKVGIEACNTGNCPASAGN